MSQNTIKGGGFSVTITSTEGDLNDLISKITALFAQSMERSEMNAARSYEVQRHTAQEAAAREEAREERRQVAYDRKIDSFVNVLNTLVPAYVAMMKPTPMPSAARWEAVTRDPLGFEPDESWDRPSGLDSHTRAIKPYWYSMTSELKIAAADSSEKRGEAIVQEFVQLFNYGPLTPDFDSTTQTLQRISEFGVAYSLHKYVTAIREYLVKTGGLFQALADAGAEAEFARRITAILQPYVDFLLARPSGEETS